MIFTKEQLLEVLDDIRARVERDDSFEGSLSYSCMEEHLPKEGKHFEVSANYRVGNSLGQGGVSIIEATQR